ncbi:MAG: periplasmic divalent cation tolerance protein [Sphingomonadales bacterium]|nr:periplasmic divalent cation tolerance protein [Sphingomonadales bacterium]
MTGIVSVYATFADAEEAARIARTLVEERLAACANILGPVRSVYRWEGGVRDGTEVAALFKTRADQAEALIARLAELHSYDVPAAVVWPIERALPAYARWVEDEAAAPGQR